MIKGLAAIWEFVVGDDWVTALGVVAALALTAIVETWVVMPIAVLGLLAISLRRAAQQR